MDNDDKTSYTYQQRWPQAVINTPVWPGDHMMTITHVDIWYQTRVKWRASYHYAHWSVLTVPTNASQDPPMLASTHQCITVPTNAWQDPPMHARTYQCITWPTNAWQDPPMHDKTHQCMSGPTNAWQDLPMHYSTR